MIVVDASAIVDTFLRRDCAESFKNLAGSEEMAAPDILYAETLQVLRKMERLGSISTILAERSISVLHRLPIRRFSAVELLWNAWELRLNLSAYDGIYVALAGRLNGRLLTHDMRLARAAMNHVVVINLHSAAP